VDASDRSAGCAPIAALLFDEARLPSLADLLAGPESGLHYFVSHAPDAVHGWAEILSNGLTFDLRGLRGGPATAGVRIESWVGLDDAETRGKRWLTLAPGPHLAGAGRLLPVIRVAATLLMELAKIGPATGIAWLPANLVVNPEVFARAVGPWLEGGAFPSPAFVAMRRESDGSLASNGLNYLMGQEFLLRPGADGDVSVLPRVAVRLIDWLVAHGPVIEPSRAVLAGTGAVFLEAEEGGRILARCD
jgi:hypothetical protein